MSVREYQPQPEDLQLTAEEAEGVRLAMEQADRGQLFDLEEVMDEIGEELGALEQIQTRRAS